MGTYTKETTLVLCLLIIAGAFALASQSVVPLPFGVKIQRTNTAAGAAPEEGRLFVEVDNLTSTGAVPRVPGSSGLPNAAFTVLPTKAAPLYPGLYRTGSHGVVDLTIAVGNYSVSFMGLPVNVSVPAEVRVNSTTRLQISIVSSNYQEAFLDLPANASGSVPAWTQATIEVTSTVSVAGASQSFLELHYSTPQAGQREVLTPLLVSQTAFRSNGLAGDEWISFQPEASISLRGLVSVGLVVYAVQTNVTSVGRLSFGN